MLGQLLLQFGKSLDAGPLSIDVPPVTIFVGPNNSGKSSALREIVAFCSRGEKMQDFKIISDITFNSIPEERIAHEISQVTLKPEPRHNVGENEILIGSANSHFKINKKQLFMAVQDPNNYKASFCQCFAEYRKLFLGGQNRIALLDNQSVNDLQKGQTTTLGKLFLDDQKRSEVRRIIYDAIGSHFVIDPTLLGQLRARLSKRAPAIASEERGIHQEAIDFHNAALEISQSSDGVRAFSGIVAEVIAGNPKVILIDEPEAFLHPSLASKLGLEICRAAVTTDKQLFVATHSHAFLMGCIQSGVPINIVRLTHRDGVGTARLLSNTEILELMRHPLLRSTGLLSGLFFEAVIVTESDADRAFYQEINERLLQFKPEWGIPNCLFINAQNKQTIQTLVRPLRKLGIPAAGIVDIDVIKEGGQSWSALLDSLSIPAALHGGLAITRGTISKAFEATGKDMKREGGIDVLPRPEREATQALFKQLAEYGLFVVPSGELESWLKDLKVAGHGPQWLIGMFERVGVDPVSAEYLKPSDDDVWCFLGSIKAWLLDPKRKGIPT